MTDRIALLSCGAADHGISRFASDLARDATAQGFTGAVLHVADPHRVIEVVQMLPEEIRLVHLQCNDWIFSGSAQRAGQYIRDLATALRARGVVLSLTLHDLPHQAVSNDLFLRRARTYRDMMNEAVAVVVSSDHERLLMHEALAAVCTADGPRAAGAAEQPVVTVIPLPVGTRSQPVELQPRSSRFSADRTIGILGYLYPGKGHREVITELAGLIPAVTVVALGRPSDGHADMLPELIAMGRELGVGFTSTGFVPDAQLAQRLTDVAVAVAPAAQVSASASINSWIAAGRRPLVPASRYAEELDARMPGAISIYRTGELRKQVAGALMNPSVTHLPTGFIPSPSRQEVATRYLTVLRSAVNVEIRRQRPAASSAVPGAGW